MLGSSQTAGIEQAYSECTAPGAWEKKVCTLFCSSQEILPKSQALFTFHVHTQGCITNPKNWKSDYMNNAPHT